MAVVRYKDGKRARILVAGSDVRPDVLVIFLGHCSYRAWIDGVGHETTGPGVAGANVVGRICVLLSEDISHPQIVAVVGPRDRFISSRHVGIRTRRPARISLPWR